MRAIIGIGIGIPFIRRKAAAVVAFIWGTSTPTKVWGTATSQTWG